MTLSLDPAREGTPTMLEALVGRVPLFPRGTLFLSL